MKNGTFEKLEYYPFDENLPELFPIKATCSNTTYITKLTNYIFDEIENTLFNKKTIFELRNTSVKAFINPRKKKQAKRELYYTLSYIRMTEYNEYKMNLAIGFGSHSYTRSTFSRTYFVPIIRNLINHKFLEIGKIGSQITHKVTRIKSTQKLINIFNKFTRKNIHFIIDDASDYIQIRNNGIDDRNPRIDNSFENWAKCNNINIYDRNILLKLQNTNSLYEKLLKHNTFIFSYNYHEEFLKNTHKYFKQCIFGYNRNLELNYNKELKIKYNFVKSVIKNKSTQKQLLKSMIPKISINRFRVKPCRIFNNNSLVHGGRIYHMFLEEIPKYIRKTVTINNQYTSCIDFKSMHPSLLYYFSFGQFPNTSIYHNIISQYNDNFTIDNKTLLDIVKMTILISLNSQDKKSAINALKFKLRRIMILSSDQFKFKYQKMVIPKKYHSFILKKKFIDMIFNKIKNSLNWLYRYFFKNVGLELMFIESLVYIKTSKIHFDKIGEYPISIHDGYVVKKSNINILQESIIKSCNNMFGSTIPYHIEY